MIIRLIQEWSLKLKVVMELSFYIGIKIILIIKNVISVENSAILYITFLIERKKKKKEEVNINKNYPKRK